MHNRIKKMCMIIMVLIIFTNINIKNIYAETVYTNPDNGYEVIIEDNAALLNQNEINSLEKKMEKITKYGNVAFLSESYVLSSTAKYVESYYRSVFGTDSGTVFFIDMNNRNIWIFSDGKLYKTVTKNYANIITDNVYKKATKGDYYECAYNAYDQIYKLLNGQRIAQPMKYISNALLSIILALIINYFIARKLSSTKKVKQENLLDGMNYSFNIKNMDEKFICQTKKYSPQSSGSSSSGGGGGGGHSGGGGGHGF